MKYYITLLLFVFISSIGCDNNKQPDVSPKILTIYLYEDILYIDLTNNWVSFELSEGIYQFEDSEQMFDWIESFTAEIIPEISKDTIEFKTL